MCGITGIFDMRDRRPIDPALLKRMNDAQIHRGPDESGLFVRDGIGLGHRRLSIIDLASGQQPLANEDGSVIVVFNGEIYDHLGLMRELADLGHQFRTRSDTEVIVHAWEQWGSACVRRFRGMFAFALWDANRETLFLARDRLGKKPLYYAELPSGQFVFASELKVLMRHPELRRDIDPRAVEDYFAFGYVPDPKCIYRAVHKLPPGHTLTLTRTTGTTLPAPQQYWDVPFAPVPVASVAAVQDELVARLREATRVRMVAEVPLGAFLSGGVDSSAIVAMMASLSQAPVNTCSIAFGAADFDESRYARQVAERYHTLHHVDRVESDDIDLVDRLAGVYDEPFADSSALPTYRVCELARRRVTVALSGDGGDECFAGYRRYRWHTYEERLRSALPLGLRRGLFGTLGGWYPKIDWAPRMLRAKSTFEALARDSVEGYFHGISVLHDGLRRQLYSPGFRRALQGYAAIEVFREHAARAPSRHPLSLVQYLDFKTYLSGDILVKVDRASMAHALEVRVPMLDHTLVEWVSGLAPDLKLHDGEGKHVLKRALEPYLPREILYRPKMGFAVPLAQWFRGPLRERVRAAIEGPQLAETGYFDMGFVAKLVDQHQSGARDHSAALWTLLAFASALRVLT